MASWLISVMVLLSVCAVRAEKWLIINRSAGLLYLICPVLGAYPIWHITQKAPKNSPFRPECVIIEDLQHVFDLIKCIPRDPLRASHAVHRCRHDASGISGALAAGI